ncbi:MAG TPA: TatD family hydrolase, partial [Anaerolineales bacterium]
GLSPLQQAREPARPVAPHGVHQDLQAGILDGAQVQQAMDLLDVGEAASANRAIQSNFRIGITGPVTFKNAPGLQMVAAALPLNSLLVETDSPFLTPQPHRGKRNEPAYVHLVLEKLAQLHDQPATVAAQTTTQNAERLFHWQAIV